MTVTQKIAINLTICNFTRYDFICQYVTFNDFFEKILNFFRGEFCSMMNYIWIGIMMISIFCAILTKKVPEVALSVMNGSEKAVTIIVSFFGIMSFWTGIMRVAEKSGITNFLSKIFSPFIKLTFPNLDIAAPAAKAICMNLIANLLGLGNAATPFGISAMKELQKLNKNSDVATNHMIMFIVLNTASLQLVPTMLCALLQKHGSSNPMEIIPYLWIISIVALAVGICLTKICEKVGKNKYE